jgi:hypothetical protein
MRTDAHGEVDPAQEDCQPDDQSDEPACLTHLKG